MTKKMNLYVSLDNLDSVVSPITYMLTPKILLGYEKVSTS